MNLRVVCLALTLGSGCLVAVAFERWNRAAPRTYSVSRRIPIVNAPSALLTDDSLAAAEDRMLSRDPFRLSNRASTARYDPTTEAAPGIGISSGTGVPKPVLVLKAIVGGPPWQAIIEGLPGQRSETTAQPGSRFDRLVVRAVTGDSVIVQSPETTWVLSFRKRS